MTSVCSIVLLVIIIVLSYYIHSNVIIINDNLQKLARINTKILDLVKDDIDDNGGDEHEG